MLANVTLAVNKGEFVYLIGRTGSGKSSLLKTLYADLKIAQGVGMICGSNLNSIKRKEIPFLRRKLGIVFQDFQLLTDRTVNENLLFVMKATSWKDSAKIQEQMQNVLEKVGLDRKSVV